METKKSQSNGILYTILAFLLLAGIGFGSFSSRAPEKSDDMPDTAATPITAKTKLAMGTSDDDRTDWIRTAHSALNNSDVSARMRAVLELRKQFSLEAIELLAKFLDDPESVVQSEAIDALGHIGLNSGLAYDVFKILVKKAMDKNFSAHGQALITSAMLGKTDLILPVIDDYISDKNRGRASYAVKALAFVADPKCIPLLTKILELNIDPEIQKNAFMTLAKIDTPEAQNLLRDYVFSLNVDEQMNSAWAIARLNKPEYNSILIDAIEKDELDQYAIGSIASSPSAPEVFGELLEKDGIDKERKRKWRQTLAQNSVYAQGDTRKAIDDLVTEHQPVIVDDPPQPPQPPSKEDDVPVEPDFPYQKLPGLFNHPDKVEARNAFQAWETKFNPKDPIDVAAMEAATKNPDSWIREQALKHSQN